MSDANFLIEEIAFAVFTIFKNYLQFPFHQYIFPHASMAACMFAFENPNAVTFF